MSRRYKILIGVAVGIVVVIAVGLLFGDANVAVLNSQGVVANKERDLMLFTLGLSAVVVVPVFVLLFGIAWHFREGNTKATYKPNWDGSRLLETVWWVVPCIIIVILSGVIWTSAHELDPYKPLDSHKKPLEVQVVALPWKWLFIYPEQGIATVNQLPLPVDTPVNFTITADAPMNSFWIPSLGGQVYAMSGMSTKLHLMANTTGEYNGVSANISGKGFAGMKFIAKVTSRADFDAWAVTTRQQLRPLGFLEYQKMAEPTENVEPAVYTLTKHDLYDTIVEKYASHGMQHKGTDISPMAGMGQ